MSRVLLVDADQRNLVTLQKGLAEAGYEVAVASSGSFALTMLEWDRPDLIVSGAQIEDMDGYELCSIVRSDPMTKEIPFLLVANGAAPTSGVTGRDGLDMTRVEDYTPAIVLAKVKNLLRHHPRADLPPPRDSGPQAGRKVPAEASDLTFQGSLGVLDLTAVVQVIAAGGKTGCLGLSCTAGSGVMVFESGRLVHAEFGTAIGELAFAALLSASQGDIIARFHFDSLEGKAVAEFPKTIHRRVEALLLTVAVELDECRRSHNDAQKVTVAPVTSEAR
jgi:CheY-like chemotaxis protein